MLTDEQQQLVADNLGLVGFTMSKMFGLTSAHSLYEDLWQEGVVGLCRAAGKFDPDIARFSTYAVFWIRQAIQRGYQAAEGKNYAAAVRHGHDYMRPRSIDALASENGSTYGDLWLIADTDVEQDALDDTQRLVAELQAHARDAIDRAVIDAAVDHPNEPGFARDKHVASLHGITVESSRRRRRALAARYHESVA